MKQEKVKDDEFKEFMEDKEERDKLDTSKDSEYESE